MTETLEAIRRLLLSHGFHVSDEPEKVPTGGLVARRGSSSVVVYANDAQPLPDTAPTLRIEVVPDEMRPAKHDVIAVPEVPGVRGRLLIER